MRFTEISVKGFEGIGHEPGIELTGLQHRNILIGPNNVGKSSFFRCMHFLRSMLSSLSETNNDFRDLKRTIVTADSLWWKQQTDKDIYASFSLSDTPEMSMPGVMDMKLVKDGRCAFEIFLRKNGDGSAELLISPKVFLTGRNEPISLLEKQSSGKFYCYDPKAGYIDNMQTLNLFCNHTVRILRHVFEKERFFDPVRTILKSASTDGSLVDGASLLPTLMNMQQNNQREKQFHALRTNVLKRINDLLESSGTLGFTNFEVKGSQTAPDLFFYQGGEIFSATKMGTGISELFFICVSLLMDEGTQLHYFLEEPETHLHPGILRRMFRMFNEYPNIQFMINTHSHVLLDDITSGDRVYSWSRNSLNHESSARACAGLVDLHQVLDALGIRASSLLQTNCVIWVEGPSDRIYLKQWLKEIGESKNDKIIDGSDYLIVTYGGSLLANFELEGSDEDFISMVRLSRFAVVLMDRDTPPGAQDTDLKYRVQHILKGLENDKERRLAILTTGREIENDIERSVLNAALEKRLAWLKPDAAIIREAVLPGNKNYFDEISEAVFADKDLRIKAVDCLKNKVRLANAVIKNCKSDSPSYPEYVTAIYDHIIRSRLEGLVAQPTPATDSP